MAIEYTAVLEWQGPIIKEELRPIALVRNDGLPDLIFVVHDSNGDLADLTGATAVFKIRFAGMSTTTNDAHNTCTVTVATSRITYDLNVADFPRDGLYEGEVILTIGGVTQTLYNVVYMRVRSPF